MLRKLVAERNIYSRGHELRIPMGSEGITKEGGTQQ
jgi:hypothetical protein